MTTPAYPAIRPVFARPRRQRTGMGRVIRRRLAAEALAEQKTLRERCDHLSVAETNAALSAGIKGW